MKRVRFHAYTQKNLGDDMFVLTMLRRYPDVRFFTEADREKCTAFLGEPNVVIEDTTDGPKLRRKLLNNRLANQVRGRFFYDAYVKIGGSIFMEPRNWKKKKPFPGWQSALLNRNKYVIGANFGPYYTREFLDRTRSSLKYYAGVCFRDTHSYTLFQDLDCVNMAPDVLFGYPGLPHGTTGEGVGISVIHPDRKVTDGVNAETYFAVMAQVCNKLVEMGIPVKLFSFCKAEGDEKAIDEILLRAEKPESIEKICYCGDVDVFLRQLNACQYLMAGRFHAMILGFAMGKRVLPMIYSIKQSNVLEDCGFEGGVWDMRCVADKDPERLIIDCLHNPLCPEVDELKQKAQYHFRQLDRILME